MSDAPIPPTENPYQSPMTPGGPASGIPPAPPISDVPDKDACQWALFCHLSSLVGYVGIPFGNLLGPLVVWLISREKHPFIDDQGKESLNFQITVTLLLVISGVTVCIGIGFVLLIVVAIYGVVMPIIAAVKSNKGERYRYPATMRLIT